MNIYINLKPHHAHLWHHVPAVSDERRTRWGNPWADLSSVRWRRELRASPSGLCGGCNCLQTSVSPSTGRSAPRTDAQQHRVWELKPTSARRCAFVSSHLQGQHHQSHADHDDHQQLGGPYPRGDVPKAHSGEGDDAEVERVEEGEVFARPLQMLDSTCAVLADVTSVHYFLLLH